MLNNCELPFLGKLYPTKDATYKATKFIFNLLNNQYSVLLYNFKIIKFFRNNDSPAIDKHENTILDCKNECKNEFFLLI